MFSKHNMKVFHSKYWSFWVWFLHVSYINLTFVLKPSLLTEIGLKLKVYITGHKVRQFVF